MHKTDRRGTPTQYRQALPEIGQRLRRRVTSHEGRRKLSVAGVLQQVLIRIQPRLRKGKDRAVVAIRLVIEPLLRREDTEPDQVLPPVPLGCELPPQLVQEPPVLDVRAAVRDRRPAGTR